MVKNKKLVVFDANALVHRAYHALPELTSPDGELVNAVYGFFLVFLKVLSEFKPRYVCTSFDRPELTFRHKRFKDYKAHRPKTPDKLAEQIPIVKKVLEAFEVPVYEKAGYEADDIIATIVAMTESSSESKSEKSEAVQRGELEIMNLEIVIVTGDLDLLQLVTGEVKAYALSRGVKDAVLYDRQKVEQRYGFSPALLADWRGLKGDASDNIPGVKGIGPKTATKLLQRFGGIEEVYKALESNRFQGQVPRMKHVKGLLLESREQAFLSKELAQVEKNVPIDFSLEKCGLKYDQKKVEQKLIGLGFKTLIARLPNLHKEQGSLI